MRKGMRPACDAGRRRDNYAPQISVVAVLIVFLIALSGCTQTNAGAIAATLTTGDPAVGRHLIFSFACGSCHKIPGVSQAIGTIGPPLGGLLHRDYIAGILPNQPDNLIHWIRHPQEIEPETAMPELGVSEQEARDIAAYLYTLR